MRLLGYIIVLCMAVTALQYTLKVIMFAFALTLLWGAIKRPLATASFIIVMIAYYLILTHAWIAWLVLFCGLIGMAGADDTR